MKLRLSTLHEFRRIAAQLEQKGLGIVSCGDAPLYKQIHLSSDDQQQKASTVGFGTVTQTTAIRLSVAAITKMRSHGIVGVDSPALTVAVAALVRRLPRNLADMTLCLYRFTFYM